MSPLNMIIQALGLQGLLGADVPMPPQRPEGLLSAEAPAPNNIPMPPQRPEGLLSAETPAPNNIPMPPQRPQSLLEPSQPTVYNNPGNVERTQGWAGMLPDTGYGSEDRFAVFDSPQMGLRALMVDLSTKVKNQGGDLREMITRYAPPSENPTEKYYEYVKGKVGKNKVTLKDVPQIAKSILEFENKGDLPKMYLNPKIFNEAVALSKFDLPTGMTLSEARSFLAKKKK